MHSSKMVVPMNVKYLLLLILPKNKYFNLVSMRKKLLIYKLDIFIYLNTLLKPSAYDVKVGAICISIKIMLDELSQ